MGISAGGKKERMSEINVTPLVDIVLVLLIIFIVMVPVKMKQVTIEVPRKLESNETTAQTTRNISIFAKADGTIILDDGVKEDEIKRTELAARLKPILEKKVSKKLVFVDFEPSMKFGDVVSIKDSIRSAAWNETLKKTDVVIALKMQEAGAAPAPQ